MPVTTISSLLTTIKTATDIAKLIKESKVSLKDAEVKFKIAELISTLADAKQQIAEIQETLIEKENELKLVKNQLAIKSKLKWESPYYWLIENSQKDGPFCQQCYDKNRELIRLQGNGGGYWECMTCRNSYTDSTYTPPKILTAHRKSPFDDF